MEKVFVYQIGCGKFGSIFLERIFEVAKNFKEAKIEVKGVADIKKESREKAKTIAQKFGKNIEVFSCASEMYKKASELKNKGEIIIYDASPTPLHFLHIYESLMHDFYHFAEKPPYMNEQEKKILDELNKSYFWSCDLIEIENPTVVTALEYVKNHNLKIYEIKCFRFNSIGIKKLIDPSHRIGVEGGCLLDKAIHEVYIAKFAEICGYDIKEWKIEEVDGIYTISSLHPKFVNIYGDEQEDLHKDSALAQATIKGVLDKINFEISCGWYGVSEEIKKFLHENYRNIFSKVLVSKITNFNNKKIIDEELRLFILKAKNSTKDIELIGDMKNFQLFLKEEDKISKLPLLSLEHDQIYRIFKKFVEHCLGISEFPIKKEYIDFIMELIFQARKLVYEKNKDLDKNQILNRTLKILKKKKVI